MPCSDGNIPKGNHQSTLFIYGRLFATWTQSVLESYLICTRTLNGQVGLLPEGNILGSSGQHGDLAKETSLSLFKLEECNALSYLQLTTVTRSR